MTPVTVVIVCTLGEPLSCYCNQTKDASSLLGRKVLADFTPFFLAFPSQLLEQRSVLSGF